MQGLDALLKFLSEEIALRGDRGASPHDVLRLVTRYYDGVTSYLDCPVFASSSFSQNVCPQLATCDEKFLERVWVWLIENPALHFESTAESSSEKHGENSVAFDNETRIRHHDVAPLTPLTDLALAHDTLPARDLSTPVDHSLARNAFVDQSNDICSKDPQGRLYASEECMWQAITGHGVDFKKIKPLEFSILSFIAAHGPTGVSQPDLIRLTAQDKRSLPKRTDELAAGKYIEKKPIRVAGVNTSWCTLTRFIVAPADKELTPAEELAAIFTPAGVVTEKFIDFSMRLLKDAGTLAYNDLRLALGIKTRNWENRVVMRILRELEFFGCLERLSDTEPRKDGKPKYHNIRYLKDVDQQARLAFLHVRSKDKEALATDGRRIDDDDDVDDDDEAGQVNVPAHTVDVDLAPDAVPPLPELHSSQYDTNQSSYNFIHDRIHEAGPEGITFTALTLNTFGPFYHKPLEHTIGRLTDFWQESQPPHIRHLAIVRDTLLVDKSPQYNYRTFANFQLAVQQGLTTWEAVGYHAPDALLSEATDDFGFSKIVPGEFVDSTGSASVIHCRKLLTLDKQISPVSHRKIGRPTKPESSLLRPRKKVKLTSNDVHVPSSKKRVRFTPSSDQDLESVSSPPVYTQRVDLTAGSNQNPTPNHEGGEITFSAKRKFPSAANDLIPRKKRGSGPCQTSGSISAPVVSQLPRGVHINPDGREKPVVGRGRPRKAIVVVVKLDRLVDFAWYGQELEQALTGKAASESMVDRDIVSHGPEGAALASGVVPSPSTVTTLAPTSLPGATSPLLIGVTSLPAAIETNGTPTRSRSMDDSSLPTGEQQMPESTSAGSAPNEDPYSTIDNRNEHNESIPDISEDGRTFTVPTVEEPAGATPTSRRKLRRSGISLNSGRVAYQRSRIIFGILDQADGVYPGDREIYWPFLTETRRGDPSSNPEKDTIKRAVKHLVDTAKIRRLTFAFKDSLGVMQTKRLLTRLDVAPDAPVVRELQRRIAEAFPRPYLPESVDIAPDLLVAATRPPQGRINAYLPKAETGRKVSGKVLLPPKVTRPPAWQAWMKVNKQQDAQSLTDDRAGPDDSHDMENPDRAEGSAYLEKTTQDSRDTERPKRRRAFARLSRALPRLHPRLAEGANHEEQISNTRSGMGDLLEVPASETGLPVPSMVATESAGERRPAAREQQATPVQERSHRPPLSVQLNLHEQFESLLPQSLDDIMTPRTPVRKGRPAKKPMSKIDFEIQQIQKWEEANTKSLTSDMRTDKARFINMTLDNFTAASSEASVNVQARWVLDSLTHVAVHDDLATHGGTILEGSQRSGQPGPLRTGEPLITPPASRRRSSLAQAVEYSPERGLDPEQHNAPGTSTKGPEQRPRNLQLKKQLKGASGGGMDASASPATIAADLEPTAMMSRTKRGPRNTVLFTDDQLQKLIVTVIVVRTLVGGHERATDWTLVHSLWSEGAGGLSREFLRKRWTSIYNGRRAQIGCMQEDFQENFIRAYEDGIVPPIDFDIDAKLYYQWNTVIDWAMTSMHVPQGDKLLELPITRAEFDAYFEAEAKGQPHDDGLEELYTLSTTRQKREQILAELDFSLPLRPAPTPDPDLAFAKSYVRANITTPKEVYNGAAAHATLQPLEGPVLDDALASLIHDKIIRQEKSSNLSAGRMYVPADHMSSTFRRAMPMDKLFQTAVAYKAQLDVALAADGETAVSFHARDGDVLTLMNLLASGRIEMRVDMPPTTRELTATVPDGQMIPAAAHRRLSWFGFTTENYKTTQMDRDNLLFPLRVVATPLYQVGTPLDGHAATPPPPPRPAVDAIPGLVAFRYLRIPPVPLWIDIHGGVQWTRWTELLATVLSVAALRPGGGAAQVVRTLRGAVGEWEVELCLGWLERSGLVRRVLGRDGRESGCEGAGWRAGEWWWCVFGIGNEGRGGSHHA